MVELAKILQRHGGDVVAALGEWEGPQLEFGNYLRAVGKRLGDASQFGAR